LDLWDFGFLFFDVDCEVGGEVFGVYVEVVGVECFWGGYVVDWCFGSGGMIFDVFDGLF